MEISDCFSFANRHPVCSFATVDGDQPRVRALTLWFADRTGFWFDTVATKNVVMQLEANPRCEACFIAPPRPPAPAEMMRVAGTVEFLDDPAIKARLLEERPILKRSDITIPDDPLLQIFRIPHGEVRIWLMENYLMGKETAKFGF